MSPVKAAKTCSPMMLSIWLYSLMGGRCHVDSRLYRTAVSTICTIGVVGAISGSACTLKQGAIGTPFLTCSFIALGDVSHERTSKADFARSGGNSAGMVNRNPP